MLETNDMHQFEEGGRTIAVNLCCMTHKNQTRFLQLCDTAVKNGVGLLKFIRTWNKYSQDITEHVFWEILEPQNKFVERGK